jgi:PAT family beta-lactamase induction signal transducer AmpG
MSDAAGPRSPRLRRWRDAVAVYCDRRQLVILLMGFASGLPLLLGFSTLSYWLSQARVSLTEIGGLLAVSTPYAVKFLWAPLLDQLPPPGPLRRLGRRRGWLLGIQLLLMAAIVALGFGDPTRNLAYMAAMALAVAFLSASQDIVIDAYRIEILTEAEQGAGAAMTQTGYRFGLLAAGAGALALSDFVPWRSVYALMAALLLIGVVATLIAREPIPPARAASGPAEIGAARRALRWLRHAAVEPLREFLARPGAPWVLLFVLLYKYGDAVAGAMANPFYQQMGFSGVEIAEVTKLLGVVATLGGVFAGGALVARFGMVPTLILGGLLQAATNLMFAWLATAGHDIGLLAAAVGADSFTGGLGSAAFVAYLSALCNVAFTGTQYALLTSLMAFGRTLLAASAGWLAQEVGWAGFFVATTGLAVPGLLLILWLNRIERRSAA